MGFFHRRHRETDPPAETPEVEAAEVSPIPPSPITGYQLTREQALKGNRNHTAARQQRNAERAQRRDFVDRVTEAVEEGEIGQAALRTALEWTNKLETADDIAVETTLDAVRAAAVVETLHKVHRLASGQSTANVAHATLTDEERATRVAAASQRLAVLQHVDTEHTAS